MSVLSTVIFADISGSTSLYETLGNERATEAVTQVTQWIGDTIEAHGGRVVKKLGDGVLALFGDASGAVSAMSAMLRHHGLPISEPMTFGLSSAMSFAYLPIVKINGLPLVAYRMPPKAIIKPCNIC